MHEPHSYPQKSIRSSPQGRISITIGKVAVEERRDKARRCHPSGTEVIGRETAGYITRERWFDKAASQTRPFGRLRSLRAGSSLRKKRLLRMTNSFFASLMSVTTFRFSALTWGRDYDGGEIAFCGQLSESGQIMLLQVIPAAEQLSVLPLQLLELTLLGFGGG